MRLEPLILNLLVKDSEYSKKVQPHLQSEFFTNKSEKVVFETIDSFIKKYGKLPPRDVIQLELDNVDGLTQDDHIDAKKIATATYADEYEYDLTWMVDETEKFCREKAIYNAIMQSVQIINGDDKKFSLGQIPHILQDALGITFDKNVGHDYFENMADRYDFYNKKEVRLKTSIDLLNKITDGGFPKKSLCLFIAQSGGGKSAVKCSLAADFIRNGHNVLYITMELAEERIAERIDANLMNLPIRAVKDLSETMFIDKVTALKSKTDGNLIIKEYPTGVGSTTHFRALLDELKSKKDFVPEIIMVDYLGICASAKYKNAAGINSYTYQKSVSEELRALAVETNTLLITSVQTNRTGFNSSDFDIESISDSSGILMTADLLLAIIRTEELDEMNQIIIKQLKNRFGDPNYYKRFIVGLDKSRMKMYNVTNDGQLNQEQAPKTPPSQTKENKFQTPKTQEWSF